MPDTLKELATLARSSGASITIRRPALLPDLMKEVARIAGFYHLAVANASGAAFQSTRRAVYTRRARCAVACVTSLDDGAARQNRCVQRCDPSSYG